MSEYMTEEEFLSSEVQEPEQQEEYPNQWAYIYDYYQDTGIVYAKNKAYQDIMLAFKETCEYWKITYDTLSLIISEPNPFK